MSILKVLNVGNGDSMIIIPSNSNEYRKNGITKVLVDLGPKEKGLQALSQNITETDKVHIFITHSHEDHIGGIDFFSISNKINQVYEITVPFYQNEIVIIAKAILSLKGIRSQPFSAEHEEFIYLLETVIRRQIQLKEIVSASNSPRLSFAYEDKTFDSSHIKCLNPPKIIKTYDWLKNLSSDLISSLINDLFEDDFAERLIKYLQDDNDRNSFNDIFLEDNIDNENLEINHNKRSYIIDFIINNLRLFSEFNAIANTNTDAQAKYNTNLLIKIWDKFVKKVHDACIVLHVNY